MIAECNELKKTLEFLYRPVESGGLGRSITEISRLIGKDRRTVSTWFRKMGIPVRSNLPVRIGVLTDKPHSPYYGKIGENKVLKIPFVATEELLWVLGFALADGSVALSARTLEIGNSEFRLLPILKNVLSKYGSTSVMYDHVSAQYLSTRKTTVVRYKKNVSFDLANYFRIRLYNAAFCRMIKNEFQPVNTRTIEFAFSEEKWAKPFLAGLWDADGWVFWKRYKRRNSDQKELTIRIGIAQESSSSEWFINRLKDALMSLFGIETREIKYVVKSSIDKNGKEYHTDSYMKGLVVNTHASVSKWIKTFKDFLKHPKKIQKIDELIKMGFGS